MNSELYETLTGRVVTMNGNLCVKDYVPRLYVPVSPFFLDSIRQAGSFTSVKDVTKQYADVDLVWLEIVKDDFVLHLPVDGRLLDGWTPPALLAIIIQQYMGWAMDARETGTFG